MKGLQDHGIIATAKHFPGHGDTDTDSHKTLPVVPHSKERLDSVELYPFRELIANGLGGIMIAHLYIPAYEPEDGVASTLSANIVNGLLRQQMGFEGLIVTDALDMKGVTKYFKPGEIELRALQAGNDILLLPEDVPRAVKRIMEAIESGEVSRDLVNERCRKVLGYKYRAGLDAPKPIMLEDLMSDLETSETRALRRELFEASATLVRNEQGLLPLQRPDTLQIAYLNTGGGDARNYFYERLDLYHSMPLFDLPPNASEKVRSSLMEELENYDLVIVGVRNTSIYPYRSYNITGETWSFIAELTKHKKVVMDVFASPYALEALGIADMPEAVLVSYQDDPVSEQAGAEMIFGGCRAAGTLPVPAGSGFAAGSGIATGKIRLGFAEPASLGIDESFIEKADSIVMSGIGMKAYPGCQVLAAKDGRIFYHKSFGTHTYEDRQAVLPTDIYDLASITKVAATTLSVMKLCDEGEMDIDRPLSVYLPYLRKGNASGVIIRDLMAHQSGFRPWIPFFRFTLNGREADPDIYSTEISEEYSVRVADGMYIHNDYYREIIDSIRYSAIRNNQGYKYSDLGFYLLKEAIENVENMSLQKYTDQTLYRPLGLSRTGFLPLKWYERARIVPTENDKLFRRQLLQGDVHDQGAAMLGGVSGHAGLFSNAFDLAVIMEMLCRGGEYGGHEIFAKGLVAEFTQTQFPLSGNRRAIGFDKPLLEYEEDGPACRSASYKSFGHSGFTGTYAWADPENGLVYVFLSNRVCPDASNGKIMEFNIRTNLHQVFYDALDNKSPR